MTRKTAFFLISFVVITSFAAAPEDSVKLRINYASKYIVVQNQRNRLEDEMSLDIGRKYVHFYSFYEKQRDDIKDSLLAIGATAFDVQVALRESGYPSGQQIQIWKNYPETGNLTFTDRIYKDFKYTEPMVRPVWKLEEGDTTIVEYVCHKATTHFKGRTWHVWYAPDIPISEGPWKLSGLPGLILAAKDSEELFSFRCIEIENHTHTPMDFPAKKYIECTKKEYHELLKEHWLDTEAFYKKLTGHTSKAYDQNGKRIVYPKRIAVLMDNEE